MTHFHMGMSRGRALGLLAGAAALASCASGHTGVAVGSKDFTEELILGEMYAILLEKSGLTVTRKFDLGGTQVAMEALQRGDIDLYPEYTGTALITQLKGHPSKSATENYATVKRAYESQYQLTWLDAAPFNDTQALATTAAVRAKYRLTTLSDLAAAAPHLRLGAIPEFTKREDGLPGLQKAYGGFKFADVKLFDIGLKYEALASGKVDVVVAFGTDGLIDADHLYVFADDKNFWPAYQAAPVVRDAALQKYPGIPDALNKLAPLLTDKVMRRLNAQVDGDKQDPSYVARAFLGRKGLLA